RMGPLIGANQTIMLWAIILVTVAVSIWLEQRYRWAAALGAIVLILFSGLFFANIGLIPHSAPAYAGIGSVLLPCAIPLFLFKCDVKKIIKQSGKLFILFHIAAIGTVIGVLLACFVFSSYENTRYLGTLIGAGAVGGTVNCIAMGTIFQMPEGLLKSYLVVGNFFCGTMILLFKVLHNTEFIKNFLPRPYDDKITEGVDLEELAAQNKTEAALFWGSKEIGLKDIATALAVTFTIVGVSQAICTWVISLKPPTIIAQTFGSIYLIMTLLTAILATVFPNFFGNIKGAMELGNIALLSWFFTIGCSGNIVEIIQGSALSLGILFIMLFFNLGLAILGAKLIKSTWEDAVIAATATIGGPPTAAAVTIGFNWSELVVPGILVGLWGYVVGNYFGIIVGNILGVPSLL
ncbi:MAG: DUF819 family protein, partial [Phascolarctobacterium sp.]|nr:DUF819 family protein [Phascolarctobacterium sp.]